MVSTAIEVQHARVVLAVCVGVAAVRPVEAFAAIFRLRQRFDALQHVGSNTLWLSMSAIGRFIASPVWHLRSTRRNSSAQGHNNFMPALL